MPNPMSSLHKHRLLTAIAVFLVVYLASLVLWIQAKDSYGYALTMTASKLVGGLKSVRLEDISRDKGTLQATFIPYARDNMLVDIPIKTSSYTFNAPLTFAIMAALYPFLGRKKRAYFEALGILASVHILYIFALEAKELTEIFMERGLEAHSVLRLATYQFLWSFVDNMAIRFEPFLIGVYMFLRFRGNQAANPQNGVMMRTGGKESVMKS
jgi:hypothetical protein